jgi:hypothetical protein
MHSLSVYRNHVVGFFFLWPAAVFKSCAAAEPPQKRPWAGEEKYDITNTPYTPDITHVQPQGTMIFSS